MFFCEVVRSVQQDNSSYIHYYLYIHIYTYIHVLLIKVILIHWYFRHFLSPNSWELQFITVDILRNGDLKSAVQLSYKYIRQWLRFLNGRGKLAYLSSAWLHLQTNKKSFHVPRVGYYCGHTVSRLKSNELQIKKKMRLDNKV